MPRAFWKGSISFGLVNIPVSLYPAEKSEDLSFHQLDKRDLSPVGYKRVNKKTEEEVPWDRIVRGYQYEKGNYVVLTDQDLKRANVEKTQTIDIVGFCEASQIPPLYFERPYYLEPAKGGAKAYALLRETLRKTGLVGIATVVMRTRQHMAALFERRGVLVLEVLRWAHELRDTKGLEIPQEHARVSRQEADMATRLVKGMREDWNPKKYKDTYADDLMALIHRKIATGKTTEIDESAPAPPHRKKGEIVDLMPLLRKSLEQRGGGRSRAAGGSAPHEGSRPARAAHGRRRQVH
jgi:DNA end-binding protein Ku